MKKIYALVLCAVLLACTFMTCAVPCFAADDYKDGTYSVPVTMIKTDSDKESVGNRYIAGTAKITVKNGEKSITIFLPKSYDFKFYYYVNGSVSGDAKEAVKGENEEFDGTVYPLSYTFPLVKDSGPVGLYFELPFLGIKPSSRLSIDYSAIKAVSLDEETTAAEETVTEEASAETSAEESAEASVTETAVQETAAAETLPEGSGQLRIESEEEGPIIPPIAYVAAAIVIIVIAVKVIKKKKSKKNSGESPEIKEEK